MKKIIALVVVVVVSYVYMSDNMLDSAVSSMKDHQVQLEEVMNY